MEQFHKDPLHGITLETIVTELQKHYGWEALGQRIILIVLQVNRA